MNESSGWRSVYTEKACVNLAGREDTRHIDVQDSYRGYIFKFRIKNCKSNPFLRINGRSPLPFYISQARNCMRWTKTSVCLHFSTYRMYHHNARYQLVNAHPPLLRIVCSLNLDLRASLLTVGRHTVHTILVRRHWLSVDHGLYGSWSVYVGGIRWQ